MLDIAPAATSVALHSVSYVVSVAAFQNVQTGEIVHLLPQAQFVHRSA
jgi:hypothetical protein